MSHENPGDGKRCDHCNQPGVPYTYKGERLSGLVPNRGERLCPRCNEHAYQAEINKPVGWAQIPAHEYALMCGGMYR